MAKKEINKQHIFLGEIRIAPNVIASMNSEKSFHDNIYNSMILHEIGECDREFIYPVLLASMVKPLEVKSTHVFNDQNKSILIKTDLRKSVTYIQYTD